MGDRANVRLKYADHDAPIYLYTHWGGTELAQTVQKSLIRGESRWDDAPYLARIIFSDMIEGNERDLTGYGIAPDICDNEHPIIEVDLGNQRVVIEGGQFSFKDFATTEAGVKFYLNASGVET